MSAYLDLVDRLTLLCQPLDFDVGEPCDCMFCEVRAGEPHIAREYPGGSRLHEADLLDPQNST